MCAQVTVEGSANTFGDAQLSVDVIADEIMWEVAKGSEVVAYGASEEEPEIVKCNPKGEYTICWDPLDGSSIVDNNWAVGTIIGVCARGVPCVMRRRRRGDRCHRRHRREVDSRNQNRARRWGSKSGKGDDGLLGATGRDQVTSLVALYGPRTTVAVALDDGVYEFTLGVDGIDGGAATP